ncbi:hypothetical protein GQ457_03G010500 [Hibiscus cannabinus]
MDTLGLLKIMVRRGINLAIRDVVTGTSDPYVIITMGEQKVKTRYIKKNCNPEWNEELILSIKDLNVPISLMMFDKDTFSDDDPMGTAVIDIQPYIEAVRLRKSVGQLPSGVALKKVQPSETNDLADESCIILENDNKITQKMHIKLKDVESGELIIQLEWADIPGSKGLEPGY